MAPHSRIILVRHAQAEHNVTFDWSSKTLPNQTKTKQPQLSSTDLQPQSPTRP